MGTLIYELCLLCFYCSIRTFEAFSEQDLQQILYNISTIGDNHLNLTDRSAASIIFCAPNLNQTPFKHIFSALQQQIVSDKMLISKFAILFLYGHIITCIQRLSSPMCWQTIALFIEYSPQTWKITKLQIE